MSIGTETSFCINTVHAVVPLVTHYDLSLLNLVIVAVGWEGRMFERQLQRGNYSPKGSASLRRIETYSGLGARSGFLLASSW